MQIVINISNRVFNTKITFNINESCQYVSNFKSLKSIFVTSRKQNLVYISPCLLRDWNSLPPTMIWSRSFMSTSSSAFFTSRVQYSSSLDGSGSAPGWLWAIITLTALFFIAASTSILMPTSVALTTPRLICLQAIIPFDELSSSA